MIIQEEEILETKTEIRAGATMGRGLEITGGAASDHVISILDGMTQGDHAIGHVIRGGNMTQGLMKGVIMNQN
jgi:predicted amino acid racemase